MNSVSSTDDQPSTLTADDLDAGEVVAASNHRIADNPKAKKHVELLEDLLRSLDALLYIELSILYYLDCAFGLLILRTLVQLFLLTERPPGLPSPSSRSALGAIIGSNLLCAILHLTNAKPEAFEATRFYLHGSLLIDFVGQLGPTSKWRLLAMDVLVLLLQVIILGLGIEKRRTQNDAKHIPPSTQDLEAEEAGIVRSESRTNLEQESVDGIEMQDLRDHAQQEDGVGQDESSTHPLDEFYTGQRLLVRMDPISTIAKDVTSVTIGSEAINGGISLPGLLLRWRSVG